MNAIDRMTVHLRLNRTLDGSIGEYDDVEGPNDKDGVMATELEQVQDICAYSRHQGLGHKISGRHRTIRRLALTQQLMP